MLAAKRIFVVLVLGLAIASGVFFWWRQKDALPAPSHQVSATSIFKKACEVFMLSDAQNILGSSAKKNTNNQEDVTTSGRSVTTCLYSYDPGSLSDLVTASILLKGSTAADSKQSFIDAKSTNAINVGGYGDGAYWNPMLGQLNVLTGKYWVIISAGSGPIDSRAPDLPKKIADIVIRRL